MEQEEQEEQVEQVEQVYPLSPEPSESFLPRLFLGVAYNADKESKQSRGDDALTKATIPEDQSSVPSSYFCSWQELQRKPHEPSHEGLGLWHCFLFLEGEGPRPGRLVRTRCKTQQALHSGREIALRRVWKS